MLYLVLRFPVGIAAFTIAVSAYGVALTFIAAPLLAPLDALNLGIWDPSTVLQGLALLPAGLLLLPAAAWVSEGLAWGSRELARWGTR
jgi:Putative sensor